MDKTELTEIVRGKQVTARIYLNSEGDYHGDYWRIMLLVIIVVLVLAVVLMVEGMVILVTMVGIMVVYEHEA